jgi:hypothetical protein
MPYLYLGFLLGQSFSVAQVIYSANIPLLTIVFSIIVFLIWSFIPVMGFALARLLGAQLKYTKYWLVALGVMISLIEQLLYHYNVITSKDGYVTMLLTATLFFAVAYLPLGQRLLMQRILALKSQ